MGIFEAERNIRIGTEEIEEKPDSNDRSEIEEPSREFPHNSPEANVPNDQVFDQLSVFKLNRNVQFKSYFLFSIFFKGNRHPSSQSHFKRWQIR